MAVIQPQVERRFNPRLVLNQPKRRENQPMVTDDRQFLPSDLPIAGQAIKDALARLQKTQSWLAEQMGVSDNAVSKWIRTGQIYSKRAVDLSRVLQIPLSTLLAGKEDAEWLESLQENLKKKLRDPDTRVRELTRPVRQGHEILGNTTLGNLGIGPEIQGKVPLISWVQAGAFAAVVDNFQPGEADEWVPTTVPIHQHTYALRVKGDSMTNPVGDPTFPDGSIIIIEPDAITNIVEMVGRFVIVKRGADEEVTFKKLVKDAGQYFLKPLNPQYPTLDFGEADTFCGVVREKAMRFF